MARRRYISTKTSTDKEFNQLAMQYGDFAGTLYLLMIPHCEDDATLTGDPDELLATVAPMRRDKTPEDVSAALEGMVSLGLITWDRAGKVIYFPVSFYNYQTYIGAEKRRVANNGAVPLQSAQISEQQRETPQNAVSPSPSPSPSVKPSVKSAPTERSTPAQEKPIQANKQASPRQPTTQGEGSEGGGEQPEGDTETPLEEFIHAFRERKHRDPVFGNKGNAAATALRITAQVGRERYRDAVAWYFSPTLKASDPWFSEKGYAWDNFHRQFDKILSTLEAWEDAGKPPPNAPSSSPPIRGQTALFGSHKAAIREQSHRENAEYFDRLERDLLH